MSNLAATGVAAAVALFLAAIAEVPIRIRIGDRFNRRYARRAVGVVILLALVIALVAIWRPFGGRAALLIGLIGAGFTFAIQELIGALAGWFNLMSGSIYRVGDRIEIGGIQGDVIDITPLRTKIMEIGTERGALGSSDGNGSSGTGSWVKGRQYTGRLVVISNKASFDQPVFNYSSAFEFVWEELAVPIPYDEDWKRAEQILLEEAQRASASAGAQEAMDQMSERYPVPRTEVEPRVFMKATDNWVELAARFVVPLRAARSAKNELSRRMMERFEAEGIHIASTTVDATIHAGD